MTEKPHFLIANLTDRYDLVWERSAISAVGDIDVEIRPISSPTHHPPVEKISDADAILISTRDYITPQLLDALPKLKVIGSYGVGLDHIDLDAAAERSVVVTHFPDYCTNEVADQAMSLILAVNRRIVQLDRDLRDGEWVRRLRRTDSIMQGPVPALRDATLGIIGFGRIGRSVARRAAPFGLKIVVHDPYIAPETAEGIEVVSLDELLSRSDIVTIHAPLTKETRGLLGPKEFATLKPTAFVVNTARGPILDLVAAAEFAAANPQGGLALDVVDPEPLPLDSPLYKMENVILTPHSAYYSSKSVEILREGTLYSVLDALRGRRPRTVANPAVLDLVYLEPNPIPLGASPV